MRSRHLTTNQARKAGEVLNMNANIDIVMKWTLIRVFTIITAIISKQTTFVHAEDSLCSEAFVPCPREEGFQFFNKTCYAMIRDTLPFGAGDAYFKCQTGMHLAFNKPDMISHYLRMERRRGLDGRMSLARVTSAGTLHTLARLQRQVVHEPSERSLVGLACSDACGTPAGWIFAGSVAQPAGGLECSTSHFCDWLRGAESAWAKPPRASASAPPLSNRLAVLRGRLPKIQQAGLIDAPQTLDLHSVACEIPYRTTDQGVRQLMTLGIATEADLLLHAQTVRGLSAGATGAVPTSVELSWRPPRCAVTGYSVGQLSVTAGGSESRSAVEAEPTCTPDAGCRLQLHLPSCSLVYVEVAAVIGGEQAAPEVVQWRAPPPSDPPGPIRFYLSEISGSVVAMTWESPAGEGPCQPYHEVTIQGHGKVTLEPGVSQLRVDLGGYCTHFSASIRATIMGRASGTQGPVAGVTGPEAPDSVEVRDTGMRWSLLHWSRLAASSSPCGSAGFRVVLMVTSAVRQLNVTGLAPGTRYSCGVCVLTSLADTAGRTVSLAVAPCGRARLVEFVTDETIPGSPSGLRVTNLSHDSMILRWRRPRQPNGVILRYNVSLDCEPQTFPLCSSDPLCTNRFVALQLDGNDTDHVTFRLEGLQAARRHRLAVAAATQAGQGPFSSPAEASTLSGVPPPPREVMVTPHVKAEVGQTEQTSIMVTLRPPCPYPGLHGYRLQFERVDFLSSYRSTTRSGNLSRDDIEQLYSGQRNISFSVFDGQWTPGFDYRVHIVAMSENTALGRRGRAPSDPVGFIMTVPPPGEVRALAADCSVALKFSFSWTNPSEHAFGIVGYRGRYQCRQPSTGETVGRRFSCRHSRCPCISSLSTDQCQACERVCNYPVRQFNFMGRRTYYYNCTCHRQAQLPPVLPGSVCRVAVQALSRYQHQLGAPALAGCRAAAHVARVSDLRVTCDQQRLAARWTAARPLEVPTKAYHVTVLRNDTGGQPEIVTQHALTTSHCDRHQCRTNWTGLAGEVPFVVKIAAESAYASPPVGPHIESGCTTPPRVPRPPTEDQEQFVMTPSAQPPGIDLSRQFGLRLPRDLYDQGSGVLREVRVVVWDAAAVAAAASPVLPPSGALSELPAAATWDRFWTNKSDSYQASPAAFVPTHDSQEQFILGASLTCPLKPGVKNDTFCNGPLRPNSSYAVQLVFVNAAGFAASRPLAFRTQSKREKEHVTVAVGQPARTPALQEEPTLPGEEFDHQATGHSGTGAAAGGSRPGPVSSQLEPDGGASGAGRSGPGAVGVGGSGGSKSGAGGGAAPSAIGTTLAAAASSTSGPEVTLTHGNWTAVGAVLGSLISFITLCGVICGVRRRCGRQQG
ncbi:uncharacterized protein LOC119092523 [Pollicipes pollicipes]|uniref:uncharacterized protein LOC119092523 n=1 Tax=Pollicipes pollicipes TaxID=41117 RepID=UPI001884A1FE|nr:uncharacterized protein LOC119092523 [Pollicipes pollicipes]